VASAAPMVFQWYCGAKPVTGATNLSLAWSGIAISKAGNYQFTASNSAGMVTSAVAILTVLPSNTFASVAGAYNGLFFQTNTDGTPNVTEASTGFLGNCVVAANGAFSAKLCIGGQSYAWSGNFNVSGNNTSKNLLINGNASSLQAFLQLDLANGTQEMTGVISSTALSNVWTAPLVAYAATNAYPHITGVNLAVSPGFSANAPTNAGTAIGLVVNSVLSLSGILGDTAVFSQTVPISKYGYVPFYVSLYNNTGLVTGWLNLGSGGVTGTVTWIRPSGVRVPVGYPQGFDTLANVTGTVLGH